MSSRTSILGYMPLVKPMATSRLRVSNMGPICSKYFGASGEAGESPSPCELMVAARRRRPEVLPSGGCQRIERGVVVRRVPVEVDGRASLPEQRLDHRHLRLAVDVAQDKAHVVARRQL